MFAAMLLALTVAQADPILPPVCAEDLKRFPQGKLSDKIWLAARDHHNLCRRELTQRTSPWLPWEEWEKDAEFTLACWQRFNEAANDMRINNGWHLNALDHLAELRRLIGWRAYYAGAMPLPPPYSFPQEFPAPPTDTLPEPRGAD